MPRIYFTINEIQSGLNRQKHAENLIIQLPEDHDGRNTWLLNYGEGEEAKKLREQYTAKTGKKIFFSEFHNAALLSEDGAEEKKEEGRTEQLYIIMDGRAVHDTDSASILEVIGETKPTKSDLVLWRKMNACIVISIDGNCKYLCNVDDYYSGKVKI